MLLCGHLTGVAILMSTCSCDSYRLVVDARFERDAILSNLTPTVEYSGFCDCGMVIEAVFEDIHIKHRVIRELEDVSSASCCHASVTAFQSSLTLVVSFVSADVYSRVTGDCEGQREDAVIVSSVRTCRC